MENLWLLRGLSLLGLLTLLGGAWLCSENRRSVSPRLVAWGMGLQLLFGLLVLRTPFGAAFFEGVRTGFDLLTEASDAGASFVFGNLTRFFLIEHVLTPGPEGLVQEGPFAISAVLAFKVLPVIIFVTALAAVSQHLRITQVVVGLMSRLMRRTMRTSGAETVGVSLLVFLGVESLTALSDYVKAMTRSEIFTLMVAFLSTIAASVMVTYASFGASPGHLLAASLMSAPAALVFAKLLVPETGTPPTAGDVRAPLPVESHNVFDAAARGTSLGLNVALQVGALLIVFVGAIHLLDQLTAGVTGHSLSWLLGWVFRPFAFLMGVPWRDIGPVSELLAVKSVFNEFLAYEELQPLIAEGALRPRSITIATYALCGFANPGSVGILMGALAGVVPERRGEVAQLCMKALVAGTLACFSTACIAGLLT